MAQPKSDSSLIRRRTSAPREETAARKPSGPAPAASARKERGATSGPVAHVPGARRAALPKFVLPQLATLVSAAPAGESWLHEMKYDGYRILARLDHGRVRPLSRSGHDWTNNFPPVAEAVDPGSLRLALKQPPGNWSVENETGTKAQLGNEIPPDRVTAAIDRLGFSVASPSVIDP